MQLETKFLRLPPPVTLGSRFGDWQVSWLGGWGRDQLYYLVMVVKVQRQDDDLKRRLKSLERPRFGPVPERVRVVIRSVCGPPNLATSTCTRTLGSNGALTELVHLDGGRDGLTREDLERFIESFPHQPFRESTPLQGCSPGRKNHP